MTTAPTGRSGARRKPKKDPDRATRFSAELFESAAIEKVESAHIYDNSTKTMRIIAEFTRGVTVSPPPWPLWTPAPLRALTEEQRQTSLDLRKPTVE
ncbi:hypothetical protein [Gordonia sp. MP11Mi]|uniref:Uncharacterized protein n=1 Tax=Gordonia sp. MP11Mi TaxID=3022769 RepID=A0AA97CXE5_9ACTN